MTILEPILPPASLSAHTNAWTFSSNSPSNNGKPRSPGAITVTGLLSPFFLWARKATRYFVLNSQAVLSPALCLWTATVFPFSAAYFPITALSSGLNVDVYFLFFFTGGLLLTCCSFCTFSTTLLASWIVFWQSNVLCCCKRVSWLENFQETHVALPLSQLHVVLIYGKVCGLVC